MANKKIFKGVVSFTKFHAFSDNYLRFSELRVGKALQELSDCKPNILFGFAYHKAL